MYFSQSKSTKCKNVAWYSWTPPEEPLITETHQLWYRDLACSLRLANMHHSQEFQSIFPSAKWTKCDSFGCFLNSTWQHYWKKTSICYREGQDIEFCNIVLGVKSDTYRDCLGMSNCICTGCWTTFVWLSTLLNYYGFSWTTYVYGKGNKCHWILKHCL